MKVLIDMNLSPIWTKVLQDNKIEAVHWSTVGRHNAKDSTILKWAKKSNFIILTHDLDFGAILALTKAKKPSVLQVRTQNVSVDNLSKKILYVIRVYEDFLEAGALIIIEEKRERVRILPL